MSLPTFLLMTIRLVLYLDFVQSWLEAIRYKGVAIYLFVQYFSNVGSRDDIGKVP